MQTWQKPALGILLTLASATANAGTVADLGLSVEQIRALNAQLTAPIAAPGIAFGSPTAFGAGWGQLFAGIGGQTIPPGSKENVDGSALVGAGFGDPRRGLGLEVAMNIISLQDSFGDDGNWNFKLHRTLPWRASLAVGIEDTGGWGAAKNTESSSYAAYTQVIELSPESPKRPLNLAFTLGVGDERFADPDSSTGVFGAVSLAVHRQGSVIADWTGRDLNIGASVVPFYRIPLVLTIGFINLTEEHEDTEFAGGVGYLYQF